MSKRLLLLATEFPPGPGGIGTHAFELARHLTRLGWTVQVLAAQAYTTAAERDRFNQNQSFSIVPLDPDSSLALRLQTAVATARQFQPDTLVASGLRALWIGAILARLLQIPWLAVGHGSEFRQRSRMARLLTRLALKQADTAVAVSRYTADLMRTCASPGAVHVIPNGADGQRFYGGVDTSRLRTRLELGRARILLTVGNVSKRKAQDVVIRALPAVLQTHPDVLYLIAGMPTERAAYERLAWDLGVAEHVRFLGVVDDADLPALYALGDLFVLVSRETADGDVEGYGIVVVEAALCGTPAIVSRGCGLAEAVRDGETGLTVPPDDPQATAVAINQLLNDDTRRIALGACARHQAQSATWAHRVAAYDRLLNDLLPA